MPRNDAADRKSHVPEGTGSSVAQRRTRRWLLWAGGALVGGGALGTGGLLLFDRGRRFWREPERGEIQIVRVINHERFR